MDVAVFFGRESTAVAHDLIGCVLTVDGCGGRIVEVEAYAPHDPASHARPGPTRRNAVMFGPPGHAYVYRSYGIHWCLNLVCGPIGQGSAVLVRALVPELGRDVIAARRAGRPERDWCRGPGSLGSALAIGPHLNGLPLDEPPFAIEQGPPPARVATTPRIGITRAVDWPWRYVEAGSPWLSGPARLRGEPATPSRRRPSSPG